MTRHSFTTGDWRSIAILSIIALLALLPGFWLGHIVGHSSALNVNWAEGFAQQLAEGHLLPRWLPNMTAGAGSAAFFFYGSLPFYVAAPFYWLSGSAPLAVICAETVMLAASGCAAYVLCRHYVRPQPALMAAAIFMLLPYHFAMDIWFRSAFAEQAAFVFMPLCFLAVLNLGRSRLAAPGLALAYAALVCSHLPSALLFTPVLAVFVVVQAWQRRSASLLVEAAAVGALSVGLCAFYLWPAIRLQGMIQPSFWHVDEAADNLLPSAKALHDFSLFILPLALEFCALGLLLFGAVRDKGRQSQTLLWSLMAFVVLLLISSLAQPLWAVAGFFNRVQFPWRALSIVELAFAVLLAMQLEKMQRPLRLMAGVSLVVVAGFAVATYSQVLFQTTPPAPNIMTRASDESDFTLKADASEYIPSCFDLPEEAHKAMTRNLAAQRIAQGMRPNQKFFYPFLVGHVNGSEVTLACDPTSGLAVAAEGGAGELTFTTTLLPEEKLGAATSALSLGLLLVFGFVQHRRYRAAQTI